MHESISGGGTVTGEFLTLAGERYYAIHNVDQMSTFFISLVSDSDHWLFIASNGGLTAGRVSPETALFPYVNVDRIYDSAGDTGSKTLIRLEADGVSQHWEPFNGEQDFRYSISRNLYKNSLGNKLLFEEINHDLQLAFRYSWSTSDRFGFVRGSELENLAATERTVEVVDGLQNILPAGTPRFTQTNSSYLVDAYKWSELDPGTGLALFTLYSAITDRAEPCESLRATTVFCLGLDARHVLLSTEQLRGFRRGAELDTETRRRGVRGAYLVNAAVTLGVGDRKRWQIVADIEQSQSESLTLLQQLQEPESLAAEIVESVAGGSDTLARIIAAGDGFQLTGEENVSAHHYANVLFNILRGGIFDNQYQISAHHFREHVSLFNRDLASKHKQLLLNLPAQLDCAALKSIAHEATDPQLERLYYEYLPITFGRRHGDPSRPWNQFAIKLKDSRGERLLNYQGNWRDIFQNWEALLLGYPEYIENIIAKFVNASTIDGYNPYRISSQGIDWEVEDPDDPWSYIGYWGDHQIIYLQKLLELSAQFHPERLGELLRRPVFSYANVPYRIRSYAELERNSKHTVDYDTEKSERIEQRVDAIGADGRLLPDREGRVYLVNLAEKLLVSLLAKLGNLVVDGGIWLNTQRPEWNDANNALVGQGLSMVTLYYLRRYVHFFRQLLMANPGPLDLSHEVSQWLTETSDALAQAQGLQDNTPVSAAERYRLLAALGQSAGRYRQRVYDAEGFDGQVSRDMDSLTTLLDRALAVIDHNISCNFRDDGLFNAYNLLELAPGEARIDTLYPMLEGQVAALSAGAITPDQACELLETLYASSLYRHDQDTFLLYPDRDLPGFLEKNRVPAEQVEDLPLLQQMLARGDSRIIEQDADGTYRFNAALCNVGELTAELDRVAPDYELPESARDSINALYERVFNHKAFTGRSGGMFGFEGLGSIYWHMIAKLLLAVQENFFAALESGASDASRERLGSLYYRVRAGIGFNKTPAEYGAFPMDPYSHTPGHAGAQQPGMTGQVKEEVLTRFGELGLRIDGGAVRFEPGLLRAREFTTAPGSFRFLDVDGNWCELPVPAAALAFTWCQVPLIYHLAAGCEPSLTLHLDNGESERLRGMTLPAPWAKKIFQRNGSIRRIELTLSESQLFPF